MQKIINTLIIEDHPMAIEGYRIILDSISTKESEFKFQVFEAIDCDSAYKQILKLGNVLKLILLDINIPKSSQYNFMSGEDLGKKIKQLLPNVKIIVATYHDENLRLKSILKNVNPEGFLIKNDFNTQEFVKAIKWVIQNKPYYSGHILELIRNKQSIPFVLGEMDIKILQEISYGSTIKEIMKEIPLSKSSIEKRKRKLKTLFNVASESDRNLMLAAKERGFI